MTQSPTNPQSSPTVSIVICTNGRAASLSDTLRSLRCLEAATAFEVCVVRGPADAATDPVPGPFAGEIKVIRNPERNLSISRNLGIGIAAGELIAFLDDDAIPEPEWLRDLVLAFSDPRVGGAGGIVYDHTGKRVQWNLYASADRLGNAHWSGTAPYDDFSFPFSFNFPYVQGTNCCFRRAALLACGGFDEEFDYYLDETDLCCRLIDEGWTIRQLPTAFVHHRYLASPVRNEQRAFNAWYSIVKNKLYFSMLNGWRHCAMHAVMQDGLAFVEQERRQLDWAIYQGRLSEADRARFAGDVDRAWRDGLTRGLAGNRRLSNGLGGSIDPSRAPAPPASPLPLAGEVAARSAAGEGHAARGFPLAERSNPPPDAASLRAERSNPPPDASDPLGSPTVASFLPFRPANPIGGRRTICMITPEHPAGAPDGAANHLRQLARDLATAGHHVHLLTRGAGEDRIDFEDAVWVHRILPRSGDRPDPPQGVLVPPSLWDHAATMLAEIRQIAARRRIDCVLATLRDCAGLAVLFDARHRLITCLDAAGDTPVGSDPDGRGALPAQLARAAVALERRLLICSQMIHAVSQDDIDAAAARHGVVLDRSRTVVVPSGPHGWTALAGVAAPSPARQVGLNRAE